MAHFDIFICGEIATQQRMLVGRIKHSLYLVGAISFFLWIICIQIYLIFTTSLFSITTTPITTIASRCKSYYVSTVCMNSLLKTSSWCVYFLPSPSVFSWGKWGRKRLGKLLRVTQLLNGRAWIQIRWPSSRFWCLCFGVIVSLIVIFQNKIKQELFVWVVRHYIRDN